MKSISFKLSVIFVLVLGMVSNLGAAQQWEDSLYKLASPYKRVLNKYTKMGAKYSIGNLTTIYKAFATYHSPEFIKAVDKQFTKLYPDGSSNFAQVLKVGLEEPGQAEFFIALYTRDSGLRKLNGKKTLWNLSLIAGEEVIRPTTVDEVDLTTFHYKFYPYLTKKWFQAYRVIFPFNAQKSLQKEITLELSSVRGTERMNFPLN